MAEYDLAIIGAGAGGLTAAIYACRAGLKVGVIEKMYAGGQFVNSVEIENMPGFDLISGYDLAMKILAQAERSGAEMIYNDVKSVNLDGVIKEIALKNGDVIKARYVIIASGAVPRKLGVENEERFTGRGVHFCATCDGGFYKNKAVAIIGGGNTAVADAKHLSRLASEVYLIHRRGELRAKGVEIEKINSLTNVKIIYNSVVDGLINDNGKLSGIRLKNVNDNELSELSVDGVFVAIGWIPSSELFDGIAKNDGGYIITDESMRTNIEGVYAVGDVRDKKLRQIVTAAADGAIAAEDIASRY